MAQEVGDAVLRFLGDSTDLDTKFDEVTPNAEKAFNPAADVVEEAGQRMRGSMRDARGEVRLLGEEFGIHLPRHVSNFVAELPGVGTALGAAFQATAVLFIAQALIQATDKLSDLIGNTLIFTDKMRESNAEIEAENKSLLALADIYNKAKEKLDELNGVTKSQEDAERALAQATVDQAKAQLLSLEATIANKSGWEKAKDTMKDVGGTILGTLIPGYFRLSSATQDQITIEEKRQAVSLITAQALRATNEVAQEEAAKNAKLALDNSVREIENQEKVALAYAQNDQEKFEIEQHFEEKKLALLNEYAVKDKAAIQALMTTIEVQQIQHAQKVEAAFVQLLKNVQAAKVAALNEVKASTLANIIELTPLEAAFQKAEDAAHSMGVVLRTDLVAALERARQAEKDFASTGITDAVAFKALQDAVRKADTDLKNFGKTQDTFLSKTHLWKQFQLQLQGGVHGVDELKLAGVDAFNSLEAGITGAFQSIVLGQQSVGKALEQALAQSLATIAAQAAVKALFYTAEGFAAMAGFQETSAGQYFAAAGEMAAVAVAAGVTGRALSGAAGGDGGSASTLQSHNSISNTGQSNRSGGNTVSVQAFAEGGLITQPTIALAGESGREAIIPLDDPKTTKALREGGVGGGTTHHWHIDGMISPDNLTKVVKQISKMVDRGQVHLTASNSLRLTKRSA